MFIVLVNKKKYDIKNEKVFTFFVYYVINLLLLMHFAH